MNRPIIIAVAANKGGVGKSTTTAALVTIIPGTKSPGWTVGMSLDSQGDLSSILGAEIPQAFPNMAAQLLSDNRGLMGCYQPSSNHSYVIPSGLDLETVPDRLKAAGKDVAQVLMSKAYETNKTDEYYDYMVIDCPPSLNDFTRAAIMAADHVIIPMQPVPLDIASTCKMIEYVNAISEYQKKPSKILGILYFLDDHYKLNEEVKSMMEGYFPDIPFKQSIRRTVKMEESVWGKGFLQPFSRNLAVIDYKAFVGEALDRIDKKERSKQNTRIW